jgi:mannan endo-1,4-beta-mannosidase
MSRYAIKYQVTHRCSSMVRRRHRRLHTVVSFVVILLMSPGYLRTQFKDFVTRNGDKLMDGDQELRFLSFNTPNLHYVEDYLPFSGTDPWRLPDEFEIRDALTTIKQLGGKVTRLYVLSVHRQDDSADITRHVEGPGKFNEDAFRALDKVLQVANEVGVRVIIPFVDNWMWWGGVGEYAAFRGKGRGDFWTDPELIADFKKTIEFIVDRENSFTGVQYKDDKAIMAWETGNELQAPFSWTREIAAYVKCLDENHLLLEGTLAREVSKEALEDPNLDIVSTHHYSDPKATVDFIVKNQEMARGKKPYIVGEFGFVPTEDIRAIMDTIINQGVAGGMIWSLRFHCREGGFYHHYELGGNVESYRWPGFSSGDFYDERVVVSILREKAGQICGANVVRLPLPAPPTLLPIRDVSAISWQGATGAELYILERKSEQETTWTVLSSALEDSRYQYRPLYSDESAKVGKRYLYRVKAQNASGQSRYSNVVGPIEVIAKIMVDEMESFDKVFQKEGDLMLLTHQDVRKAKEDASRLTGKEGSYVIYKVPTSASSVKIDAFWVKEGSNVSIAVDSNLTEFKEVPTKTEVFRFGANDYGFFDAVSYVCNEIPPWTRYVRISLHEGIQIGRVEISYSPLTSSR